MYVAFLACRRVETDPDMLVNRRKPMGAMIGDIVRTEVPFYVASGRRDTTPEQEVEYLQKLVEQSAKVEAGWADSGPPMPGRTET
jgi:hypothetical protein